MDESCCICGTVKNCQKYLDDVFKNISQIVKLFKHHYIIIYYDHSNDNTLEKLNYYKSKFNMTIYYNKTYKSEYRTHRLAYGRNYCLDFINKYLSEFEYFIMMDFDDVCSGTINIDLLKKTLSINNKWDALTFNKAPYYDLWALSVRPYIFSYAHFENPYKVLDNMSVFITEKLNALDKDELLPCFSAFNGFAIYKTNIFKDCRYDGKIRLDLIPQKYLKETMYKNNSEIIFNNENWLDSRYEDCEHRSFHFEAIHKKNARIFISPEILIN